MKIQIARKNRAERIDGIAPASVPIITYHQHSELDQIEDFQFPIFWLAEANLPCEAEKWLTFQA